MSPVVVRSVVDPWHFGMDPDPNPANFLSKFVPKSRSWGKAAFSCLKMSLGKIFSIKKKFWPVSDLDPNSVFGSWFGSGFESAKVQNVEESNFFMLKGSCNLK